MSKKVAFAYTFHDRDWHGGRNYFASLFSAIGMLNPQEFSFVFVMGRNTETSLPAEFPFLEIIRTPLLDRWTSGWLQRQVTLRAFNSDPRMAHFLRANGVDILSHSEQLGANPGIKTVTWLYDFQFLHLPEYWKRRHVNWAKQRYVAACRNCDALILSSHSALKDLETFAPWCTRPRHVLQFVSRPVDFNALTSRHELIAQYGLPASYFFLPNQFWSNKNHQLALDALKVLRGRGVDATIVCTGRTFDGRRPEYFSQLMKYCHSLGLNEQFRVLGVVPYRDTQALMAHARAVINPSRFEGWSTTVEEAKTMGKTLLLSDIPVHREQAPQLGRFFPTDDPGALANRIEEVLDEPSPSTSVRELETDYLERLRRFGVTYLEILRALRD